MKEKYLAYQQIYKLLRLCTNLHLTRWYWILACNMWGSYLRKPLKQLWRNCCVGLEVMVYIVQYCTERYGNYQQLADGIAATTHRQITVFVYFL